jgi:hypothetical protein
VSGQIGIFNFMVGTALLRFTGCLVLLFSSTLSRAQIQTAGCVHSKGFQFLSDAYLASLGACNCQRTGVILDRIPDCNTNPFELQFEDNFDGDSLDKVKWQLVPHGQGALKGAQRMELSTLENVKVADGICQIIAQKETIKRRAVNWKPDSALLEDGLQNLRTYDYTSSLIFSRQKFFY